MKSKRLAPIILMTLLAALLAVPVWLAAQEQQQEEKKEHTRYKLIDLGTFGGPESDFVGAGGSNVANEHGEATGAANTPTPDPNGPNNCFGNCFVQHTFQWSDGVLTDLGALPGINSSGPNGINAEGVITGISQNGAIDPLTGIPEFEAVLWKEGQIVKLGTFGGNFSYANDINNRGQVVGFALNMTPDSFGLGDLCMTPRMAQQMRAFIWQGGELQNLGTLGGPDSCALYVNQSGQATGHSFTNSVVNPLTGFPTIHPFLWNGSTMLDLGTLGGTKGLANAINNRSQVVGQMNLAGDLTFHPFLWDRGSLTDLGTLGGTFGVATSLNNTGEIVGGAANQNDQAFLAFVWRHGVITNLGTVDGDPCSEAKSINAKSQVVGISATCDLFTVQHAFLWDRGSIIDLNIFVPPSSDLTLTQANFISSRGEITAEGVLPNGDRRAVLLIPCDEDHPDVACEDAVQGVNATQSRPAPIAPATHPSTASQGSLTPEEMMAALRARLGKRYHIPGLGAPKN